MARGDVTQQSLVLQSPFFPRILDMGNIISAWENTGERVEGVSWGVGGTKHLVPPNTTVVAVPWLCPGCWPVTVSQCSSWSWRALAHGITDMGLFRAG